MQLSKKGKTFSAFFWYIVNLDSMLNIFKKKVTFIADVFLNLRNPKDVVTEISKESHFIGALDK